MGRITAFCSTKMVTNYCMENNNFECPFCGKVCKNKNSLSNHVRLCNSNPNKSTSNLGQFLQKNHRGTNQFIKAKELGLPIPKGTMTGKTSVWKGKHLSEETKKKVSESMKKAHAEGRAHNIGNCRWNNKPSYPEEWFMKVIKNEKLDSNYIREMPFHGFSLDFAWVDKKFCVEIDGEQHYREGEFFEKQRERDNKKDELLKEEGWTEIRVSWAWICNNTKSFIEIVKNNLNNLKDLSINVASKQFIKNKKQLENEQALRKTEAIKNGTLASNGHLSPNKLSFEEWEERKNLIKKSGVDLTKFGRVEKLVKITGLTKRQVENTLKHFNMFY